VEILRAATTSSRQCRVRSDPQCQGAVVVNLTCLRFSGQQWGVVTLQRSSSDTTTDIAPSSKLYGTTNLRRKGVKEGTERNDLALFFACTDLQRAH
jgi:hypothetical protein